MDADDWNKELGTALMIQEQCWSGNDSFSAATWKAGSKRGGDREGTLTRHFCPLEECSTSEETQSQNAFSLTFAFRRLPFCASEVCRKLEDLMKHRIMPSLSAPPFMVFRCGDSMHPWGRNALLPVLEWGEQWFPRCAQVVWQDLWSQGSPLWMDPGQWQRKLKGFVQICSPLGTFDLPCYFPGWGVDLPW